MSVENNLCFIISWLLNNDIFVKYIWNILWNYHDLYDILINIILNYQYQLNRKVKDRYDKK